MDLGAYAQIEDLESVAIANGISVPRLRGYRLMSEQKPLSIDEYSDGVVYLAVTEAVDGGFKLNPGWLSSGLDEGILKRKLLSKNSDGVYKIRWSLIHGKKRKCLKYQLKKFRGHAESQVKTFNKYVGRSDILYIHARIGGGNWDYYGGREIEKQPWFIEKVDDLYDGTYCDIYAKISKGEVEV